MKTPNTIKQTIALAIAATTFWAATASAQVIYSDPFSGSGGLLNGTAVPAGSGAGNLWSANNAFNNNGTISGANEGSALLTFNPVVGREYTLTMDVANSTDRWIAMGFARDPLISPGANNTNDRLSNEPEGISWMLFRNTASLNQDVQVFAGLRTANVLYSGDPVANFAVGHQLKIVVNTSVDLTGATFTANFFVDGSSLLAGGNPVTIVRNIDDINFVGMAYDNSTATPPTFDNFLLTEVPEPSAAALAGLGMLAVIGRMRRRA